MYKLIALYNPPHDPRHFQEHLRKVHLPLVAAFPGLRAMRVGFNIDSPTAPSPYHAAVECEFDDATAMHAALASAEGQAASADVPNYAGAGVTIIHFHVESMP